MWLACGSLIPVQGMDARFGRMNGQAFIAQRECRFPRSRLRPFRFRLLLCAAPVYKHSSQSMQAVRAADGSTNQWMETND